MDMIQAYKKMFANYANFNGRANRAEYWWVALCQIIIYIICYAIMFIGAANGSGALATIGSGLLGIYGLATIVPLLALTIRRLHDSDKSGWFILLGLIPCVGGLISLVLVCLAGTPGSNRFGEPSDFR